MNNELSVIIKDSELKETEFEKIKKGVGKIKKNLEAMLEAMIECPNCKHTFNLK